MPSGGTPYEITEVTDFGGGVNVGRSRFTLGKNQVVSAVNYLLYPDNVLQKRKGYEKLAATPPTGAIELQSMLRFSSQAYNITVLAYRFPTETKFYKLVSGTLTQITGGSTFATYPLPRMFQFLTYCLFFNGASFDYTSAFSTKAACGFVAGGSNISTLKPDMLWQSDQRLFIHDAAYPNSLWYTEFDGWPAGGSPANWDVRTNNEVLVPDYGPDTLGIVTAVNVGIEDSLITFRTGDIWKLLGVGTDYTFIRIASPTGCSSRDGAVTLPDNSVVFTGGDGDIYELRGDEVQSIGNDIRELLKTLDMTKAKAVYHPFYKAVFIGFNETTLVWFKNTRGWTTLDIPMSNLIRLTAPAESNALYFSRPDSVYPYLLLSGATDDGTAITTTLETQEYIIGQFTDPKRYRNFKVLCDVGDDEPFAVAVRVDGVEVAAGNAKVLKMKGSLLDGPDLLDYNFVLAGGSNVAAFTPGENAGHHVSLVLTTADALEHQIFGLSLEHATTGRRREQ